MGILNVTPDSCYDQGRWGTHALAIQRGIQLYEEGAQLIDIGGESTRPGAAPVSESEELNRVIPVIKELKKQLSLPLSIDTMKPRVAAAAIEAGVSMINDVSGFSDPAMRRLAADSQVQICVMHMQGTPATMQIAPSYPEGVIPHLCEWFAKRIDQLLDAGLKEEQIILDPGIGFGKTVAHNVEIVNNLQKIKALGFPVLLGLSRKSFIGKILNKRYPDLLAGTLAITTLAILAGVDILRVHDVIEHQDVLNVLRVVI